MYGKDKEDRNKKITIVVTYVSITNHVKCTQSVKYNLPK
jgi:hypothetical protein